MDIFHTQLYQSQTLKIGATLALKHRLYISGWALSQTLQFFKMSESTHHRIAIGFCNDVPVSVAVLQDGGVMAFCRKQHRRKGYTGACVRALHSRMMVANVGIDGSWHFWNRLGVTVIG